MQPPDAGSTASGMLTPVSGTSSNWRLIVSAVAIDTANYRREPAIQVPFIGDT